MRSLWSGERRHSLLSRLPSTHWRLASSAHASRLAAAPVTVCAKPGVLTTHLGVTLLFSCSFSQGLAFAGAVRLRTVYRC